MRYRSRCCTRQGVNRCGRRGIGSCTHRFTSSSLGRNSFKRTTLSTFFRLRSMLRKPSQSGSKGSTSVMSWSRRSCETPNEHSVRKVALPFCECVRVKLRERGRTQAVVGEDVVDEVTESARDESRFAARLKWAAKGESAGPASSKGLRDARGQA